MESSLKGGTRTRAAVFACGMLLFATGCSVGKDHKLKVLISNLKDPHSATRVNAAMELSEMGPDAQAAVPELAAAVLDMNLNVRYYAAKALKGVGPGAQTAVPSLIKALDTFPGGSPPLEGPERYYGDARSVAAEALGAIGPGAREAVPALKKALNDENPSVREAAAEALERIAPQ